jgi:glycosyltransferase involved in cell wall biosynthesis
MTGVSEDPDIRVHGNVDGDVIWEGLARADVFLFPSYWASEGHSGAVIEAMMVGIPVIAARWRSTPEVVVDGVDGLLCEPRDAKSLAEQMVRIALDEALRARLGNRAKQTARRFDAAIICGQLRELFEIGC